MGRAALCGTCVRAFAAVFSEQDQAHIVRVALDNRAQSRHVEQRAAAAKAGGQVCDVSLGHADAQQLQRDVKLGCIKAVRHQVTHRLGEGPVNADATWLRSRSPASRR